MRSVSKRLEIGMEERERTIKELAKSAEAESAYRVVDDMINIKLSKLTHVPRQVPERPKGWFKGVS